MQHIIISFTSSDLLVLLSTVGTIYYLYIHSSVNNKIKFSLLIPFQQFANVIDPSC